MLRNWFFLVFFVTIIFLYFLRINHLGDFLVSLHRLIMANEKIPKIPSTFECEKCNYICCSRKDFNKHLDTRKHSATNNANEMANEMSQKIPKIPKVHKIYACQICNNEYKHQSSLCKHSKTCQPPSQPQLSPIQPQSPDITTLTTLIMELIKNSTDVQKQVLELCKTGTANNTIHGNVNNNNQKFNINVFLNEECKNAMNFSDFIKNIKVSREDLENNAQLGFVNGVSKILIESLKQLSKTERPIHCTDIKRETMYIKDDNKWTKEDHTKINSAIQEVTRNSLGTLMNWKDENPDYKDRDSVFSERCIVIQQQSMAAHNRDTYYPQVVKAIAKEVVVDK